MFTFDYILVGGGLQNGLLALALRHFHPHSRVLILETSARLGGNHTWCFHAGDVSAFTRAVVEPLIVARWSGYGVKFPGRKRFVAEPYAAVSSERLHAVVMTTASQSPSTLQVRLSETVRRIEPPFVETLSGLTASAPVIVDSRGPESFDAPGPLGYQKFVGLECLVEPNHALQDPILMDATVEQSDGYRFFYTLPLAPDRVLVEDTYYSDTPNLDVRAKRTGILQYAGRIGVCVRKVIREETGVLPLPGAVPLRRSLNPAQLLGGYSGGWFHPTSGYSFPVALRLATTVGQSSTADLGDALEGLATAISSQQRYCVLLNRLLFNGFASHERVPVFERFYGLPTRTIRNFYALEMHASDRLRILCGRPPSGLRPRRMLWRTWGTRNSNNTPGAET